MKKSLICFAFILPSVLIFNACQKIEPLPDVPQPIVLLATKGETFEVGDTTITTGALKNYEQDSKVIFKISVKSTIRLTKFSVRTTSDAISDLSQVLRTEPANAIDASGDFIKNLNNVDIYYAFHIHALVPPLTEPILTFKLQNEKQYEGTSSIVLKVIKKGSSQGKPLIYIDCSFPNSYHCGIGSQKCLDYFVGYFSENYGNMRGPFLSFDYRCDLSRNSSDVINTADKIDLAGYYATSTRTNDPNVVANTYYLVSPGDSVLLTSTYAGALVARITLATTGTASGTVDITVSGVTRTATYVTSTTQTATNFASVANKAAYLAAGVVLTNSGAVLTFSAINDGVGFGLPTTVVTTAGTMYGNDEVDLNYQEGRSTGVIKDILMRNTYRAIVKKLANEGKPALTKGRFLRLDNRTGADSVSAKYYGLLTHDNEFDQKLANVVAQGKTVAGPFNYDQVWGFVMENGKRGLICVTPNRTMSNRYIEDITAVDVVPGLPTATTSLYCTMKVQDNK